MKLYDMANSQHTLDLGSLKAAVQALAESVEITQSPSFAGLPEAWRNTLIAGVVRVSRVAQHHGPRLLARQSPARGCRRTSPAGAGANDAG